jgi:hypothetical protein
MNKIELLQTGGFPFENEVLDYMQNSYTLLNELASSIAGTDPVIVKGCVVTGSSVSDGVVIIAGEVLPFIGGSLGAKVAVIETVGNKVFEDGISKPVYKTRHATFGVSGIDWSSFKRLETLKAMQTIQAEIVVPTITSSAGLTNTWGRLFMRKVGNQVHCTFNMQGETNSGGGFGWGITLPPGWLFTKMSGCGTISHNYGSFPIPCDDMGDYRMASVSGNLVSFNVGADGAIGTGVDVRCFGSFIGFIE